MEAKLRRQISKALDDLNKQDRRRVDKAITQIAKRNHCDISQQLVVSLREQIAQVVCEETSNFLGRVQNNIKQQLALGSSDADFSPLPNNCKYVNSCKDEHGMSYFVYLIEQKPTVRTIQLQHPCTLEKQRDRIEDDDKSFKTYQLAFPYVYFKFFIGINAECKLFDCGESVEIACRRTPFQSLDDKFAYVPLPNTSGYIICNGDILKGVDMENLTASQYCDAVITAYWNGKHTYEMQF